MLKDPFDYSQGKQGWNLLIISYIIPLLHSEIMKGNNIYSNYYNFTTFIEKLKRLERFRGQFFWKDYPQRKRYESVADHTWRLAMLVMLFKDKLHRNMNLEKALQITMIHDLSEIITGDDSPMGTDGSGKNTHAYNKEVAKRMALRNQEAAKKIFEMLPRVEAQRFYILWLDYEMQRNFEAKVVKALDKIECMLQVLEYRKGNLFKEHYDFTIKYGLKYAKVDPAIKEFGEFIAEQIRRSFKEFRK